MTGRAAGGRLNLVGHYGKESNGHARLTCKKLYRGTRCSERRVVTLATRGGEPYEGGGEDIGKIHKTFRRESHLGKGGGGGGDRYTRGDENGYDTFQKIASSYFGGSAALVIIISGGDDDDGGGCC